MHYMTWHTFNQVKWKKKNHPETITSDPNTQQNAPDKHVNGKIE